MNKISRKNIWKKNLLFSWKANHFLTQLFQKTRIKIFSATDIPSSNESGKKREIHYFPKALKKVKPELTLKTRPVHSVLIKSLDGDYLKQGNYWLTFVRIWKKCHGVRKNTGGTDNKGLNTESNYQAFCGIRRDPVYTRTEQDTEIDVAVSQSLKSWAIIRARHWRQQQMYYLVHTWHILIFFKNVACKHADQQKIALITLFIVVEVRRLR